MKNYIHLFFCSRCYQMKNHRWMGDTPCKGLFSVECCACGRRPVIDQVMIGSAIWEDIAIEENKEVVSNAT